MAKAKATKRRQPSRKELEELANFGPAFDKATMFELEKVAGGQNIGVQRRVALGALTLSAEELVQFSKTDGESYAEMRRVIEGFKMHADGLCEAATAAALRIAIADVGESLRAV